MIATTKKSVAPLQPRPDFSETEPAFGYDRFSNRKLNWRIRLFQLMNSPRMVRMADVLLQFLSKYSLLRNWMISYFFTLFCGGETLEASETAINDLHQFSISSVPDYSIEGGGTEYTFAKTEAEIIRSTYFATQTKGVSLTVFKITAFETPDYLTSVATQLKTGVLSGEDLRRWKILQNRVERVCQAAYNAKVTIMVDAEETWLQYPIDLLVNQMMRQFNKKQVIVMNTYQIYLKRGFHKLRRDHNAAQKGGYLLGAKVVRGAYMEKERARAKTMKYQSPIHLNKAATDTDYNAAIDYCLQHHDTIFLFAGTHNETSIYRIIERCHELGIPRQSPHVHIAQLYGMGDTISFNLAKHGYRVSKYLPYGKAIDCLPYLIRRAYENTASQDMASRELELLYKEKQRRKLNK